MAEKISTLILKVDLDCHLCYKKIKKTLCKLQDRENIQTIAYNEKNKTVTISGPFDPHKLSNKLRCKACNNSCKVIKDIQIKENPKDPKPAGPVNPPHQDKPKPAPPTPEPAPPAPAPAQPVAKPDPPKAEPEAPKGEPPQLAYPYSAPVWSAGSDCCRRPWYEGYNGGYRCCSCGCEYGRGVAWGPPVDRRPYYEGHNSNQFFCEEEDPSCIIM